MTAPGESDRWSQALSPGIYTLKVHADKTYKQEINLKKGDRIIVNLVDGPNNGIGFQRALYSDSEQFRNPEKIEVGDWRLAVLKNKLQPAAQSDRLQIFASLERRQPDLTQAEIAQVRPQLAWFQLGANDVEHPEREFSLRWHERIFYPGPAWQFDVPRWIKDVTAANRPAQATLKAWWRDPDARPFAADVFQLTPPGNTSDLPRDCHAKGGSGVIIESITVETHPIEVLPDPPIPKSCLVVRMAFPKGSPYIVDPEVNGLHVVSYEHRLYSEAGKYTGLFWPVNTDELEKLSTLKLISLNELQNEAVKQKTNAELKLSQPRTDDQIPDPPVPVSKAN